MCKLTFTSEHDLNKSIRPPHHNKFTTSFSCWVSFKLVLTYSPSKYCLSMNIRIGTNRAENTYFLILEFCLIHLQQICRDECMTNVKCSQRGVNQHPSSTFTAIVLLLFEGKWSKSYTPHLSSFILLYLFSSLTSWFLNFLEPTANQPTTRYCHRHQANWHVYKCIFNTTRQDKMKWIYKPDSTRWGKVHGRHAGILA